MGKVESMSTSEVISLMSEARDQSPQIFSSRKVIANGREHTLLSRSVKITILLGGFEKTGLLIFGDQNPLGRSNHAREVFRGLKQAKDIRWLYFKDNTRSVTWLGYITFNNQEKTSNIKVLLESEYYSNNRYMKIVTEGNTRAPF